MADLESTLEAHRIRIGQLSGSDWKSCSHQGSKNFSALEPRSDNLDDSHPLYGKTIVFTGALDSMTRLQAAQLVVDAGGHVTNSISRKVDLLVSGIQDARNSRQAPLRLPSSRSLRNSANTVT